MKAISVFVWLFCYYVYINILHILLTTYLLLTHIIIYLYWNRNIFNEKYFNFLNIDTFLLTLKHDLYPDATVACATTTTKPRASTDGLSKTPRPLSNILPSGIRPASSVSTQTNANQAQNQVKYKEGMKRFFTMMSLCQINITFLVSRCIPHIEGYMDRT